MIQKKKKLCQENDHQWKKKNKAKYAYPPDLKQLGQSLAWFLPLCVGFCAFLFCPPNHITTPFSFFPFPLVSPLFHLFPLYIVSNNGVCEQAGIGEPPKIQILRNNRPFNLVLFHHFSCLQCFGQLPSSMACVCLLSPLFLCLFTSSLHRHENGFLVSLVDQLLFPHVKALPFYL